MAFLNETGLATFLAYVKAWARATFASKTDTQTIEGATTFRQTITGNISGNAATATKLATARSINGVAFDGSANITITKLGASTVGSSDNPIYLNGGTPTVTDSVLNKRIKFSVSNEQYADIVQTVQSDNNDYRSCTIRCYNGNGYNEITLGAHNETNGSPGGIAVRNTGGTITVSTVTPATSDNSTHVATTAFVKAQGYVTSSHTHSYLPLSGGTLTGTIVAGEGNIIKRGVTNSMLSLYGGNSSTDGARLELYGGTRNVNPGSFHVIASIDSSTYKAFLGKPDGTLTWNGQNVQVSSDERIKTQSSTIPDDVLDAWGDVQWGQFQYLEAVAEKGESARMHLGLLAQRVEAVFKERGLDACEYGILCYEAEEDLWMIRYTEALAMEAACQRRRADRLEARVMALEEAVR